MSNSALAVSGYKARESTRPMQHTPTPVTVIAHGPKVTNMLALNNAHDNVASCRLRGEDAVGTPLFTGALSRVDMDFNHSCVLHSAISNPVHIAQHMPSH